MAEIKFSINGQPNHPSLPFAVELMWNHLRTGAYQKASEIGSTMAGICKDLGRELWDSERRRPDSKPGFPSCPF